MSDEFINQWNEMQSAVHNTAVEKGWWKDRRFIEHLCVGNYSQSCQANIDLACIALIISELSEAMEAIRHGNPLDDKIPRFKGTEAELADAVIRIMDLADERGWRVGEAIIAKAEMNKGRPVMHGGKVA